MKSDNRGTRITEIWIMVDALCFLYVNFIVKLFAYCFKAVLFIDGFGYLNNDKQFTLLRNA